MSALCIIASAGSAIAATSIVLLIASSIIERSVFFWVAIIAFMFGTTTCAAEDRICEQAECHGRR